MENAQRFVDRVKKEVWVKEGQDTCEYLYQLSLQKEKISYTTEKKQWCDCAKNDCAKHQVCVYLFLETCHVLYDIVVPGWVAL